MRRLVSNLTLALAVIGMTGLAHAKSGYVSIPKLDGKASELKIRFVKYDGGSTGKIMVDVRNTTNRSQTFDARGLFFVPNGDPERAPQRLGAAGPFEQQQQGQWERKERTKVKPGQTVRLKLQVFCLDSHRSSPGSEQGFSVARKRLPKALRKKINRGAKGILMKSSDVGSANSEIQGHVWKTRNKKWIKLQGERKTEKSPGPQLRRRHHNRIQLQQRIPNQLAD